MKTRGGQTPFRIGDKSKGVLRVPARAGRTDADVKRDMMDALAAWIGSAISRRG